MRVALWCLLSLSFAFARGQDSEATLIANGKSVMGSNNEMAINCFTKAIELNSQNAIAFYLRGNIYSIQKKYNESINDYTKAIELDPKYTDAYINRGVSKARLKKYQEAIDDYTKGIELNPKEPLFFYNRGGTNYILKNYKEAVIDFQKAMELKPDDIFYKQWLRKSKRKVSKHKTEPS